MLPWYYLREFQDLGVDVRALCHARVRDQLREDMAPSTFARMHFVEDSWVQRLLFRLGRLFPYRIDDLIFNQLIQLVSQLRMRRIARDVVTAHGVAVVFQPTPISAKALSFLYRLGVPVVIGPMSGGMELPPAFRGMDSALVRWSIRSSRTLAALMHRLFPGKREAAALLVANRRTRRALPPGVRGRICHVMESAVDLDRWRMREPKVAVPDGVVSFIFCSRFVDWKGIRYLVQAFAPLAREGGVRLELVGDGDLFEEIRAFVEAEGISGQVVLHGRLPLDQYIALLREADVFVSPSLRECGGIAMMEAMAIGVPVIAAKWGGAEQYAGTDCAILVEPVSEDIFVAGLTSAMRRLALSPELRSALGVAGRRHLEVAGHGWRDRASSVLRIIQDISAEHLESAISAPQSGFLKGGTHGS